ncbi:MAG: DUF87 domain-containing protein [Rhizobium sp.]|nr:MAG: DUF87 domain-containing protein [Rhizobium sp.]
MQFRIGYDFKKLGTGVKDITTIDFDRTINSHVLILGDSGTGKTTCLRRLVDSIVESANYPVRLHILDSHGDISTNHSSSVTFSESAQCGLNPLYVNPDPDYGGVRRTINAFISTVNRATLKLGFRQEACLRALLLDLYAEFGMHPDNPATWLPREVLPAGELTPGRIYLNVPFEDKDLAKRHGCRWDVQAKCWYTESYTGAAQRWPQKVYGRQYPTMLDLVRHADARLKSCFLGGDQNSIEMLTRVNKRVKALTSAYEASLRDTSTDIQDLEPLLDEDTELESARNSAISAYSSYVHSIRSGNELDALLKYGSLEILKAITERLKSLYSIGIFKNINPPFDENLPVRRYNIAPLASSEKLLFVDFTIKRMFDEALQAGVTDKVRDIIIIDEAAQYIDDDTDSILNKAIREARKFGLAIILASQTPEHMSSDLLSQVATKIILGLDKSQWPVAQRKLGIDIEGMEWIIPKKRAIVLTKMSDVAGTRAAWVALPKLANPSDQPAEPTPASMRSETGGEAPSVSEPNNLPVPAPEAAHPTH